MMVNWKSVFESIFAYETPKIVTIRSLTIGVISRLVQISIIAYIVGYAIVYKKGYQEVSPVESSVTTKVKGVAYTNFSDEEFDPRIKDKSLYRRVWDVADYVVPPSENNAVFIATNINITPDQTQSTCPEDITIKGAECDPNNNTCAAGTFLPVGNGVFTGNCTASPTGNHSCEIYSWCPVETDINPLLHRRALLEASENFTILIKNFVFFPKFKDSRRRNIKNSSDKKYLQNCHYDPIVNIDCPIFRVGDIVEDGVGRNFSQLAVKGAVIEIRITWDCDFDWNKENCFPTYLFKELDDPDTKLAKGWNFRYAQYFGDSSRTLYKMYGIKFVIIVQGQAGRFMIVPLLLNIGAGLGLLVVQRILCDIIVLYLAKRRSYYKSKKYENVLLDQSLREETPTDSRVHSVSSVQSIPQEEPELSNKGYLHLED